MIQGRVLSFLVAVLVCLCVGSPASGQCNIQVFEDAGYNVAVRGDVAIVALSAFNGDFADATIFRYNAGLNEWEPEQVITAAGLPGSFGATLAIDRDLAVLTSRDGVHIFRYFGFNWIEEEFIALPTNFSDISGVAVYDAGVNQFDRVAIGRKSTREVLVYRLEAGFWQLEDTLTPSSGHADDEFGAAVAMGGDAANDFATEIIVGAPGDDDQGSLAGATYHFTGNSGTWTESEKYVAPDGQPGDLFGLTVAMTRNRPPGVVTQRGHTIAIAAPEHGGVGAVYLLKHVFVFQSLDKLVPPDGVADDRFGSSIAIDLPYVLVGSDNALASNTGYLFERQGSSIDSSWALDWKLIGSSSNGFEFGESVGLGSNWALSYTTVDKVEYQEYLHFSNDCNLDFVPDCLELEAGVDFDCNQNGVLDSCDISSGFSQDCNLDGIPDDCHSDTYASDITTPISIPEGTGQFISDTIDVDSAGTIADVNLHLEIDHTWNGDLTVRVTHHGGTAVVIDRPGLPAFPDYGCDDNGFNIVLDDEGSGGPIESCASGNVEVVSPPAYTPNDALSAFDGMELSGEWEIEVSDSVKADFGELVSWSIEVMLIDCNANGTLDSCDIANGATDCDGNSRPDSCDIALGEADCNGNGVIDLCELPGVCELHKFESEVPEPNEFFGGSVDIEGDLAIVGASQENPDGAAYIYRLDQTTGAWEQEQILFNPSPGSVNSFGIAVAIEGDVAVVSDALSNTSTAFSGEAFVYRFDGLVWALEQELAASDTESGALFGISVDLRGNTIIIGAEEDNDMGAAYVFQYNSSTELWEEQTKLTASDGATGNRFGTSVALGDRAAIIGDSRDDINGDDRGSAYVFVYDDLFEVWNEFDKLTADDAEDNDLFGWSVTMSRDVAGFPRYIMVGAIGVETPGAGFGAAYAYEWRAGGITPNGKLYGTSPDARTFGEDVAIDGLTCAIGVRSHTIQGLTSAGAVYIYQRAGDGVGAPWVEQMKIIPADPGTSGLYGTALALSGSYLITGASNLDAVQGAAYIVGGMGDCNSNGVLDCVDIFCGGMVDSDGDAVPDECAPPCPADIANSKGPGGDGVVNLFDLLLLLDNWGTSGAGASISDQGGGATVVDLFDLLAMLDAWGACE